VTFGYTITQLIVRHTTLLLIDTDWDAINILTSNFIKSGYKVFTAQNGLSGIELANTCRPDVIITELLLPEMDGVDIILTLRNQAIFQKTAIIVFSSRTEDYSAIAALDAGADEYVIKPARFKILEAKIKAILRRYEQKVPSNQLYKRISENKNFPLVFDSDEQISIKGVSYNLANKEIKLLQLLCSQPGRIFTREEIFQLIWNTSENSTLRTIDVHVRKLREKIGDDWIKTYKGVGYKLNEKLLES
jgi:two-component system, OmpR family, alkaline phosphatase synthesis response regulator PhoP